MYDRFFGLNRAPLSMTPDPDALFLTDAHREALAGLSYAVARRKGFVVLEGEAGTGKTTLIRRLLKFLPGIEAQTSVVLNPVLTPAEFLELILMNLGLADPPESKAKRLLRLERLLWEANQAGRVPVLIVDEAHKLSHEVLEEIRLLTNFETSDAKLLQIVLTGQPELSAILNREELWQLKQRIAVRLRIVPLSPAEVKQYLHYRWKRAGGADSLPFSDEAISLIARWSRGIPRLINSICDNALLLAFGDATRDVGAAYILEVISDLDLALRPEAAPALPHEANGNGFGTRNGTVKNGAAPDPTEPAEKKDQMRELSMARRLLAFRWIKRQEDLTPSLDKL